MDAIVCDFFERIKPENVCDSSHMSSGRHLIKISGMRKLTDREYRDASARRIKAAREAAGYTNGELCRILGVRPSRITSWENGKALPNTPRLWIALCEALDITADFIISGATRGLNRELYARLKEIRADSE